MKARKNASLYRNLGAWQGVKLTRLKKVLKFLIKIQLTKYDPKSTGGGKCPPSCQLGLKRQALCSRSRRKALLHTKIM